MSRCRRIRGCTPPFRGTLAPARGSFSASGACLSEGLDSREPRTRWTRMASRPKATHPRRDHRSQPVTARCAPATDPSSPRRPCAGQRLTPCGVAHTMGPYGDVCWRSYAVPSPSWRALASADPPSSPLRVGNDPSGTSQTVCRPRLTPCERPVRDSPSCPQAPRSVPARLRADPVPSGVSQLADPPRVRCESP